MENEEHICFAINGANGVEEEWMFNHPKRFKFIMENYRNTLPEDNTPLLWCTIGGKSVELETFGELLSIL